MFKKIAKSLTQQKTLSLTALIAGSFLTLSFAPFKYYPLAELSLLFLLFIWHNSSSPRLAFFYGWLFGCAFFGCGTYWVYISIYNYGNAPMLLAIFIVVLMVSFLALYPALQGYILSRFFSKSNFYQYVIAFPAISTLSEWLRGWLLSGFPWLFVGYSHIDAPIKGWATVFGVYGVSFFVYQTGGVIFYILLSFYKKNKHYLIIGVISLVITLVWLVGNYLINTKEISKVDKPIKVSLIQGNIPLEKKWNEKELSSIIHSYIKLTKENLDSKIIVWPETAIPTLTNNVQTQLNTIANLALQHNSTILSGIPIYNTGDKKFYNSIIAFGTSQGIYYKRHLVPFGEYTPFRRLFGWLKNYILIPMSDFSSGPSKQQNLSIGNILIAPFICYEIAYGSLLLNYLPQAGLIVTVCDDSWFDTSIAAVQHLEIARMRSLEASRYQLLVSSTGITAIINNYGQVVAAATPFKQEVLTNYIWYLSGTTPWVKYGQYIWLFLIIVLLLLNIFIK